MSIELDKIKLIRHDRAEGKTKVLNSVFNLNVSEKREIVEHRIPGMEGGVLQDMGRSPVRIDFDGMVYGKDAKEVLKELRARFKAGKPMPFTSDLTAVTDITQVIIEDLDIFDVSGSPQNYKYRIKLREYIPPKKKDDPAPSQDADAKKSVDQKADDAKNNVDAGNSEAQSQAGDDQQGDTAGSDASQSQDDQQGDASDTQSQADGETADSDASQSQDDQQGDTGGDTGSSQQPQDDQQPGPQTDQQPQGSQTEDHPASGTDDQAPGTDDQAPSSGDTGDAPTLSTQQPSGTDSQPSGGGDAPASSTEDPNTGSGGEDAPSSSTGEQQNDGTRGIGQSTGGGRLGTVGIVNPEEEDEEEDEEEEQPVQR